MQKSGFFYPNKFARIYLDAFRQVLGEEDFYNLAGLARLPQMAKNPLPDNLEKSVDFVYITEFRRALDEQYGAEQAREHAYTIGKVAFDGGLKSFGDISGMIDLAKQGHISFQDKLKVALPAMADIVMQFSDQVSRVYDWDETTMVYTLERCPMCWGVSDQKDPLCQIGQGFIEQSLKWLSGGHDFQVEITQCAAQNDELGKYLVYHAPESD